VEDYHGKISVMLAVLVFLTLMFSTTLNIMRQMMDKSLMTAPFSPGARQVAGSLAPRASGGGSTGSAGVARHLQTLVRGPCARSSEYGSPFGEPLYFKTSIRTGFQIPPAYALS